MTFPLSLYFPSRYRKKGIDRTLVYFTSPPSLSTTCWRLLNLSVWAFCLQTSPWTVCRTSPPARPSATSNSVDPNFSEAPFLPCCLFLLGLSPQLTEDLSPVGPQPSCVPVHYTATLCSSLSPSPAPSRWRMCFSHSDFPSTWCDCWHKVKVRGSINICSKYTSFLNIIL